MSAWGWTLLIFGYIAVVLFAWCLCAVAGRCSRAEEARDMELFRERIARQRSALVDAGAELTEQMAREAEAQPQYYQQQPQREVA